MRRRWLQSLDRGHSLIERRRDRKQSALGNRGVVVRRHPTDLFPQPPVRGSIAA